MHQAELVEALAAHIRTQTGGWANQNALQRVERLVAELLASEGFSEDDRRRLQEIRSWAEVLYDTRRHRRWHRGTATIRRAMLSNLERIRSRAELQKKPG